jgi:hypothetical protein
VRAKVAEVWLKLLDTTSMYPYYFNTRTQESRCAAEVRDHCGVASPAGGLVPTCPFAVLCTFLLRLCAGAPLLPFLPHSWVKPLAFLLGEEDLQMTPRSVAAMWAAYPPT